MILRIGRSAGRVLSMMWAYRQVLSAVTRVELAKRYSGSAFGKAWLVINPLLLLSIYLFVYLVVFKMRFPGLSEFDYTLYVFAGLVPYIGMSEALNSGAVSLRQNMHLVKNVMLPVDLIPVRTVLVALTGQVVSILIVALLVLGDENMSWRFLLLPVVIALQVLFLLGCVFVLSAVVVALPDVANFVNLSLLLLMFISPIGFKPEMVPGGFQAMIYLNPVYYMTEAFRTVLLANHPVNLEVLGWYALICVVTFALGCAFFRRFKNMLVDYE
jgi:lipopolysaccharide transport system permease protein